MSEYAETLKRSGKYPLCDRLDRGDLEAFGLDWREVTGHMPSVDMPGGIVKGTQGRRQIKAVWTGEKRPPRKGEWYLSGAIIGAYKAPNDLTTAYHIARLILTETRTTTVEVEV